MLIMYRMQLYMTSTDWPSLPSASPEREAVGGNCWPEPEWGLQSCSRIFREELSMADSIFAVLRSKGHVFINVNPGGCSSVSVMRGKTVKSTVWCTRSHKVSKWERVGLGLMIWKEKCNLSEVLVTRWEGIHGSEGEAFGEEPGEQWTVLRMVGATFAGDVCLTAAWSGSLVETGGDLTKMTCSLLDVYQMRIFVFVFNLTNYIFKKLDLRGCTIVFLCLLFFH